MGHLNLLLRTLSGRVETDVRYCKTFEASKEEKWRSIKLHCFGITLDISRVNQLCCFLYIPNYRESVNHGLG